MHEQMNDEIRYYVALLDESWKFPTRDFCKGSVAIDCSAVVCRRISSTVVSRLTVILIK